MKLREIHIRDPFILLNNGKYYLYGTRCRRGAGIGFDVYISEDLIDWSDPVEVFKKTDDFWGDRNYWAPEVHEYNGKFYMFASFKSDSRRRATEILVADKPDGMFRPHNKKSVTPEDWECLDGTFFIDGGIPYMIFCHEWVQVRDGEICAVRLSDDLTEPVGEPFILFKASEPEWALRDADNYVTDGPFLYRATSGKLVMIWSSFSVNGYVEAVAYSDNGRIDGNWIHEKGLLFADDGGHGMIFKDLNDKLRFVMHSPNKSSEERAVMLDLTEEMLFI